MKHSIRYGADAISFTVHFVARRTLEIAVHPDGVISVRAPVETKLSEVKTIIRKRAGWIQRQQAYFHQFHPRSPARRYIGGETHLYLGRQYRLKTHGGGNDTVKLLGRYLHVSVNGISFPPKVENLLYTWYEEKAVGKLTERFNRYYSNGKFLPMAKPKLQVRRMRKRWGSLSKRGLLTLNTDLVRASMDCIDYVIVHEICHLRFHNHGPEFYRLLEKVMPDWEKRKHKLELMLA